MSWFRREPRLSNIAVVRRQAYSSRRLTEKETHEIRVRRALGIPVDVPEAMSTFVLNQLKNCGFIWRVDRKFILSLSYCACVGNNSTVYSIVGSSVNRMRYTGDIPDFALDNLEKAKSCGLTFFTIHSNFPLPVEKIMDKTDPVLVGWCESPEIRVHPFTYKVETSRKNIEGMVIAIWDEDRPVEI